MKDLSSATSFIRRLGPIDIGRVIMGSIILVCMGLSWIVRDRIAQSWLMTARFAMAWILLPLTHWIWPIAMSLMAIGIIGRELGMLLRMKSKYGPGGEFEPDWYVILPNLC